MGRVAQQKVSRRTIVALGLLAALPWGLQDAQAASKAKPAAKPATMTASQASARLGFDLLTEMGKADGANPNPVVSPASLAAAFRYSISAPAPNSTRLCSRPFVSMA